MPHDARRAHKTKRAGDSKEILAQLQQFRTFNSSVAWSVGNHPSSSTGSGVTPTRTTRDDSASIQSAPTAPQRPEHLRTARRDEV